MTALRGPALAGASRRDAVTGAARAKAARGEPDDVGVDRDVDGGVIGVVVGPAGTGGEHGGQGVLPGAWGELVQPVLLARDPGAGADGLEDGAGGVAGRGGTCCHG
jgi:hypothetical protein